MKSDKLTIILFVIIGAAAIYAEQFNYSEVDLNGACPKIRYINNFNFPRICGFYYEAFSSLTSTDCYNGNEGLTMYGVPYDDQTLLINFCCRSATSPSTATCGKNVASGTVKLTSTPGALTYAFNNKVYTIYVLDTDYDNYTIVYGCNSTGSRRRDELILIHSRHYQLSKTLEDRIRTVVEKNGGNWSNAKRIEQGPKMAYTPNNPKPRNCN